MLNGLVTFEVDTFFTTTKVGIESLYRGSTTFDGINLVYGYGIHGQNIPEISGILDNYRSVITTFGMNDYTNLLHIGGGSAGRKYASIHLESLLGGRIINGQPIEPILDPTDPYTPSFWKFCMELYLHEFTHTVEMVLWDEPEYQHILYYHGVLRHYRNIDSRISEIEVIRLFLLNQAVVDGGTAGIPLYFWKKMNI